MVVWPVNNELQGMCKELTVALLKVVYCAGTLLDGGEKNDENSRIG